MPIAIACPGCGKGYNLADTQRGKTVVCRGCDEPFVVGQPDRPRRRDEYDDRIRAPDRPPRPASEDDRPRRRDREEVEDLPRRDEREERPRRKRSGGGMLLLWLMLGGGGALIFLVVLVLVLVLFLPMSTPTPVDDAAFARIQVGMTKAEVESVMGRGEDATQYILDESQKRGRFAAPTTIQMITQGRMTVLRWRGRGNNQIFALIVDGRVKGAIAEIGGQRRTK